MQYMIKCYNECFNLKKNITVEDTFLLILFKIFLLVWKSFIPPLLPFYEAVLETLFYECFYDVILER